MAAHAVVVVLKNARIIFGRFCQTDSQSSRRKAQVRYGSPRQAAVKYDHRHGAAILDFLSSAKWRAGGRLGILRTVQVSHDLWRANVGAN